ncbi:MAG: sugar ABC transporter substrate-binding protein [Christensenellaceae bacterium]|jgi:inositol transport system substrate-binding protein
MKKVLTLMLALVMVVAVFAACSQPAAETPSEAAPSEAASEAPSEAPSEEAPSEEASEEPVAEGKDPMTAKYLFAIGHMSNAWAVDMSNSMESYAAEVGIDLEVRSGEKDINTQVSQIESAITEGFDVVFIESVAIDGIGPALQQLKDAGIVTIMVVQKVSDPEMYDAYVGNSNEDIGRLEMQRAMDDIGGEGKIAVLTGPMGSDSQIGRSAGYEEVLANYPDVEVVREDEALWTTEDALKLAENWLQTDSDVKAFVCQNDPMALGAIKALEDMNLNDSVFTYGVDAVPDGLQAIADGRMTATVNPNTYGTAVLAIDTAMALLRGETLPEKDLIVECFIVDKDNVADYLPADAATDDAAGEEEAAE